jgi:peptidoglycan/LPS O-acetylase OafA/YrhL
VLGVEKNDLQSERDKSEVSTRRRPIKTMQTKHILPLTGMRLFAAGWVVLYHFQGWLLMLFPFLHPLAPFFGLGYNAVPFFFLLSGFILSHNYFSVYSVSYHPKFVFLRFARLWPVHFTTLVLVILGPDLCSIFKGGGHLSQSLKNY